MNYDQYKQPLIPTRLSDVGIKYEALRFSCFSLKSNLFGQTLSLVEFRLLLQNQRKQRETGFLLGKKELLDFIGNSSCAMASKNQKIVIIGRCETV